MNLDPGAIIRWNGILRPPDSLSMKRLRKAIAIMAGLTLALGYISMKGERMWDGKSIMLGVMWGVFITCLFLRDPERLASKSKLVANTVIIATANGVLALMLPPQEFTKILVCSTLLVTIHFIHAWAWRKEQEIHKNADAITEA